MQADLTDEETAHGLLNLLTETIARKPLIRCRRAFERCGAS
jgi:hypothetical protein